MAYQREIPQVLMGLSDRVFRYFAPEGTQPPYLVWAEDGAAASVFADGRRACKSHAGTIDLFTLQEDEPLFDQVEAALDELEPVAWRLNSVQYEQDTGLIHYEWRWEYA